MNVLPRLMWCIWTEGLGWSALSTANALNHRDALPHMGTTTVSKLCCLLSEQAKPPANRMSSRREERQDFRAART